MGVPEKREGLRPDPGEDGLEVRRVREVAVRLDEHRHARRLRLGGHLLEAVHDALQRVLLRLVRRHLVPEHADVGNAEGMGEVDEAAALVELGRAHRGVLLVHPRRRAEVGDHDPEAVEVAARLLQAVAGKLGPLGEVHLPLDATHLDPGVAQAIGLGQDRLPRPPRAAEGGEGDRQAPRAPLTAEQGGGAEPGGQATQHVTARDGGQGLSRGPSRIIGRRRRAGRPGSSLATSSA